jgi:hypothetical protein
LAPCRGHYALAASQGQFHATVEEFGSLGSMTVDTPFKGDHRGLARSLFRTLPREQTWHVVVVGGVGGIGGGW